SRKPDDSSCFESRPPRAIPSDTRGTPSPRAPSSIAGERERLGRPQVLTSCRVVRIQKKPWTLTL
ncbi:hypothetical protein L226DRAFT_614902, partial [Lentinus tigrinus ALCF2SS1-7]|uniref:uncharacterized protein n=1 Tax=Lentinus tigrinus ALCF2SS1-7 TaxID=1328758 RepID=UPI001165EC42